MSGYDTEYDYVFDYFGPFKATVTNPDVHKKDKIVLFEYREDGQIYNVKASKVKDGEFSFSADAGAAFAYVILDKDER